MGLLTHTINSTQFVGLSPAQSRCSLGAFAGSAQHQIVRFHPPGTSGNYLIWAGREGQTIVSYMRYFGSASQVLTMYKTDREAWEQQSVTIVDSEGTTFLRCTLNPGGFRIIGKPRSIGLNKCFIDCEATFTRDS